MGWIAQRLQASTRKGVVIRCVHGVSHRFGLVLFNDPLERIHVSSLAPLDGCLIIHRRSSGERVQTTAGSSNRLHFCRLYISPAFGFLEGPCARIGRPDRVIRAAKSVFESSAAAGTGHRPLAAGYTSAPWSGGKLPLRTGW
jgi:hypothetical protein